MLWMKTTKKILDEQASTLQRTIDRTVLQQWRYSSKCPHSSDKMLYRSLSAPFALHDEHFYNNQSNYDRGVKSSRGRTHMNVTSFNDNFNELVESLKKLGDARTFGNMSPVTEKIKLKAEIDKITELQKKLEDLKFYNIAINTPYEGLENRAKKYVSPPSIII